MNEAFVKCINVKKEYKTGDVTIQAVDDMSFEINKGEFVVIVGPSGAGKTTILNILGGMDTLTSGQMIVDGIDISRFGSRELTTYRRYDIGFVFQFYNLVPNLTALENVELANQISRNPLDAETVLQEVGLSDRLANFPAQLSGGEQQRVSIARAILKNAPILILDEASAYADAENEHEMQLALAELIQNKTVIMIAHRLATICNADQILVIEQGRIVQSGTHEELLKQDGIYADMWKAGQDTAAWIIKNGNSQEKEDAVRQNQRKEVYAQ